MFVRRMVDIKSNDPTYTELSKPLLFLFEPQLFGYAELDAEM